MKKEFKSYLSFGLAALAALSACHAVDQEPSNTAGKKWHPGHYVNGYYGNGEPDWILKQIKDNQNIKGVSFIHLWRELEPSKGVYDFSHIEKELSAVKAIHKQLIIQIADKTFGAKYANCVPDYLLKEPPFKGGQAIVLTPSGSIKNCTALRWLPEVQDRLIALYEALGKRFDADPNLEAVMLQEDAVIVDGTNMGQYSRRSYTDQQKRGMAGLAKAFPNTIVYKFLNWGPNTDELFEYAYQLGIGIGGPDLIPDSKNYAYPNYKKYAGKMPLEISVQSPGINKYIRHGGTLEKVYDFGTTDPDGLRVDHLVWDPAEDSVISFKKQILPLINARKGITNTTQPSNRTSGNVGHIPDSKKSLQ